jgi:hypothetical protein
LLWLCILHDSCWRSGEKERHSQSGVKPPHSKESRPVCEEQTSSLHGCTRVAEKLNKKGSPASFAKPGFPGCGRGEEESHRAAGLEVP